MPETSTVSVEELERSFNEYERPIRIRNYKLGALLAAVFMPAGAVLDFFVYGWEGVVRFAPARILTTAFLAFVGVALIKFPQCRHYRALGFLVALIPLLAIAWMIYAEQGTASPYYAGLNLVMLGSAILLRWSSMDSVIIFLLTFLAYILATVMHEPFQFDGLYFNNLYFLFVTGVFIIAGSWYYNSIRQSEFELRWRLDINRAQLEESNQKLRELDELKSRFFANISHELRTPLTLLIAPLETLLSRGRVMAAAEMDEMLATMHGNAMRLLKLINDLLDLVRLESGKIEIKKAAVPIEDFLDGIVNAVSGVASDKHIALRSWCQDGIGRVMLDADKLERICLNLIFNALKFTPAGGQVNITAEKEEGWLRIEVKDTGVGMSREQLKRIFTRFWQADTSSRRKFQGMGIGLALVKELSEAHGGSVEAVSEEGKGTTMIVRLPLETAPPDAPEPEPNFEAASVEQLPEDRGEWISELYRRAELFPAITSLQATMRPIETGISRRSKKPKLLIADDEPDMLRFLRSQLGTFFDVLEAVDGNQVVEKATQFLPDIVLTDMMMPEKDGLQVCRELRDRTSTRSIPVVLLTARADEKTKIDCLEAGASDFLAKPFSLTELCVRLKNLVDNRLYQKQLVEQKQQLESAFEQIKETEALIIRNEKLASLGKLSAGLIHEINNPLNYAKQGLYGLRRIQDVLPEAEKADFVETLGDIEHGVDRVARIIADLRGFSRTTREMNASFPLKSVVETTMRFFGQEFKEGVGLEMDIPDDLEIRGDSNQIVQVLINFTQNALDAMRTKTYPEGEGPAIRISAENLPGRTLVRFRDNGPGIPEDMRSRIFDPFFTTKDVGEGMGLGLSICHRIIADHGGHVDIHSREGAYCEFVLEFPLVETNLSASEP
ncbi:MAG TPA: hypothetical protein DIT13_15985 [Verrucomicrobiales bacterium]|nr:hypothetical protein [Verrucomicrobiales bacterium]HRJ08960.1 ATP-binding protein [Prosthecobacter sp.]HRK15512.1 ATP-binding protein [Prosthecobacter sp.]